MNLERIIAVRTSKTIYKDGNKVIKLFDKGYSKADVLNEALNQARVEETNLAIPKINAVTMIEDRWAIVSDYIKGKTLADLMLANPEKKDEYLDLFLNLQIKMHNTEAPMFLNKLKDKMAKKIELTDLNATTRYELRMRLESMPKHHKLCHGDFNPSNIIISKDQTPYIIDWSHVTQGNASADVARTYLLFWLEGDIETAEKYLNLYCEKTQTSKKYVQSWLPIVAASQSVKGKKEEREFLLSWVNVVDYV
jgi:RIO-like serine/threonine protein kinase